MGKNRGARLKQKKWNLWAEYFDARQIKDCILEEKDIIKKHNCYFIIWKEI